MKTIKTQISNLVLSGAVAIFYSCGGGDEQPAPGSQSDSTATVQINDKTKTVEITMLAPQLFNSYVDIQGKVDATENIALNAEMPGTVSKINVRLGQEVNTGQVLAELDAKVIQQGIAELQGGLELATTFFEKQKNLWEQKIGTEMHYLQAKTQKESLEKRMAQLQEQLKMSKIISPINGVVDAIDIKIGQATMPGMSAIRVVNLNSLEVKGEVSESYLSKVKAGNEVVVILPDLQDTVKTKISYAARVISPLNRTFTATVNLIGTKDYHPNQVAIMKIIDYANPKAFVVPVSAVQRTANGDFLFLCEASSAKKVKVKMGRMYNGKAEILEGLKEGDQFISKGYQELNDGEKVRF